LLTRKAQEATIATTLLSVQVCAVASLGEVSHPKPSSNSARATFIPVPTRNMLSVRSIATPAEASCKHGNDNPTACQDPPSAPQTAFSPTLAIADTRNAPGEGGLIAFREEQGRAGQGGTRQGGAVHPTRCGGFSAFPGYSAPRHASGQVVRWGGGLRLNNGQGAESHRRHGWQGTFPSCGQSRLRLLDVEPQVFRASARPLLSLCPHDDPAEPPPRTHAAPVTHLHAGERWSLLFASCGIPTVNPSRTSCRRGRRRENGHPTSVSTDIGHVRSC